MHSLVRTMRTFDEILTSGFDRAFDAAANPWRHLGSLAFLYLAAAAASGIIAYALYDTSVTGAYESGRRLQQDPLHLGRLLRGMHRYAADGFMLLTVLHLLREGARGHFLGVRWFSWLTGVPLAWLLWIAGITGLWLLWDERSLYSITATAEWLQVLPLAGEQLARNFLSPVAINDRFFSLVLFVHIGVPLMLLGAVWIHIQRIAHVRIWPPRELALGSLALLAVLALAVPAQSLGPADARHVAATMPLDWFYLFTHPIADAVSPEGAWAFAAALTIVVAAMPLLRLRSGTPLTEARVDLANCNGCARCAADCPFGAVVMVPRTDGRNHPRQASVVADLCAACGICVGACPSSTPFRSLEDLVSGIELPDVPVAAMRKELQRKLEALTGAQKIVLFSCRQAAELDSLSDSSTAVMPMECAAMVPPSFVEYALRLGAEGVAIAGCRESDCEFRLGDRWVAGRFSGEREPRLRAAAPRNRVRVAWAGGDTARVRQVLSELRNSLSASVFSNRAMLDPTAGGQS